MNKVTSGRNRGDDQQREKETDYSIIAVFAGFSNESNTVVFKGVKLLQQQQQGDKNKNK